MIKQAESIVGVSEEVIREAVKWVEIGVWEGVGGGRKGENLVKGVRFFSGLRVFWGAFGASRGAVMGVLGEIFVKGGGVGALIVVEGEMSTMKRAHCILMGLLIAGAGWTGVQAAEGYEAIRAVGLEGAGNEAAGKAWNQAAGAGPEEMVAILKAMNGANPLAQNWLRAAVETVADRARKGGRLPEADLAALVKDTANDTAPRLLAYEMLMQDAPKVAEALRPGLLNDPAAELRLFAVAELLKEGQALKVKEDKKGAVAAFKKALDGARDEEQINALAKGLKDLGEQVDLPKHFGFLMKWQLIAPFTNVDRGGFDQVFPPEVGVDLKAKYEGKGTEAVWVPFESKDEYGMIDFNEPFGMLKEVTGYAHTEFEAAEERQAEIRLGCKNGWKVWLNGKLLFGRDEYHRGMKLDQYKLPVTLKKGKNTLLVKCCQNEQTEQWTVEWRFQLRICDATGTAILPKS
jgi:hypothetical protein